MENILLPAFVAWIVFVVFLVVLLKTVASDKALHKKNLLDQMEQETRQEFAAEEEIKLLKETESQSALYQIPGIKQLAHLIFVSGLWEKRALFFLGVAGFAVVLAFLLRKLGFFAIVIALVAAFLVPYKYLGWRINKRRMKFLDMFPDAIDLIVRSVRSGHPINTAIKMIAENMESPVREEFRIVSDEVSYGSTLPEALRRMAARLELADIEFFVVVLSVQQETGGSLTEVLTNLSNIIRKRKALRQKIRAMTSEGRATSYILGSIPVVEFIALYYLSPSYIDPLFTTLSGNIMLGIAIGLIVMSQIVIRRIIDIEI